MPSHSDRRAWLPVALAVFLAVAISLVAGAGPWMVEHLAPTINRAFEAVSLVFGVSVLVHALLLIPSWLAHRLLSAIMKVDVA